MHKPRQKNRDDQGVVAIELVLILPFLLMLLMGIAVLGSYLSLQGQASNLARNGARQAALFPGTGLGDARLSVVGDPCPVPRNPNLSVTVKATLPVALRNVSPLVPVTMPPNVVQTVTMRCGG